MKRLLLLGLLSSNLYGEVNYEPSYNLGINLGMVSEVTKSKPKTTLLSGIEVGASLFKYEPAMLKNIVQTNPSLRFLKFSLGLSNSTAFLVFSPISIFIKDNIFLSPSFVFGKYNYTAFSFSYELI